MTKFITGTVTSPEVRTKRCRWLPSMGDVLGGLFCFHSLPLHTVSNVFADFAVFMTDDAKAKLNVM